MSNFTDRLSDLRSRNGVSLQRLSEAICVSLRAMKYYASGEREPGMSVLCSLADYFDVSIDYLVGRSDVP